MQGFSTICFHTCCRDRFCPHNSALPLHTAAYTIQGLIHHVPNYFLFVEHILNCSEQYILKNRETSQFLKVEMLAIISNLLILCHCPTRIIELLKTIEGAIIDWPIFQFLQ